MKRFRFLALLLACAATSGALAAPAQADGFCNPTACQPPPRCVRPAPVPCVRPAPAPVCRQTQYAPIRRSFSHSSVSYSPRRSYSSYSYPRYDQYSSYSRPYYGGYGGGGSLTLAPALSLSFGGGGCGCACNQQQPAAVPAYSPYPAGSGGGLRFSVDQPAQTAAVLQGSYCPYCGNSCASLPADASFCTHCGKRVR